MTGDGQAGGGGCCLSPPMKRSGAPFPQHQPQRRHQVRGHKGSPPHPPLRWIPQPLLLAFLVACIVPMGGDCSDDDHILQLANSSQCPYHNVSVPLQGVNGSEGKQSFRNFRNFTNFQGRPVAMMWNLTELNGTKLFLPDDSYVDNTTNLTIYRYMGLNATCGCSNGTLTIDWSNISHNKYAPQLVESFATTLRRNGGDPPGGTPIPEVVGGGVGNSTSLENVTRLTNVTCISYDEFERWCDRGLISQAYCPRVARNQTGQTTKIVYVENVVTIVTNITKQVNNSSNIENVLQREIDAFLASFRNPSTYFYQSNLGIGEFANVMLWAGFLLFCLVSIILQWLSSRTKSKYQLPMMLHTLTSTFTMLGYLVMAFGHGRSYDSEVIFGSERNSTSGGIFFSGAVLYVPHVPPYFYSRYIMWMSSSTPCLFLLCHLAGAMWAHTFRVLAINILMLISGLLAASTGTAQMETVKWVFYSLGCLFFSTLLIQLSFTVRTRAVKSGTGPAYDKMLWFVYVFWPLYPILWLIGPQGIGAVTTDVEVVLWVFLDVLCKLGFITLFTYLKRVGRRALTHKKVKPEWLGSAPARGGEIAHNGTHGKGFIPPGIYKNVMGSGRDKEKERIKPLPSSEGRESRISIRESRISVTPSGPESESGPNILSRTKVRLGRVLSSFAKASDARQTSGDYAADVNLTYGRKTFVAPSASAEASGSV